MMAFVEGAQTQPANEGSGGSEIAKWLKSENLGKLIPLFEEEEMTLKELIEFADDEANFKQYLKEINVPNASIFRIISKIKKIKKPKQMVVITQKELDAIDNLTKRNTNITSLIEKLAETDEQVSKNETVIKSKINEEYNNLILLINQSQENALKKLNEIVKKKKQEILTKSQQLETLQNNTKNGIKNGNELIYNININKNERQTKILSMVNGIMNEKIPPNIDDVPTDIILVFNKKSISPFISGLTEVYGMKRHPIPVIENIKCDAITQTACTVQWQATLSEDDLKQDVKSKLYMKIKNVNEEMDEKEREELDSELFVFDKNNKDYKYQMNGLKKDSLYKMKMVLFEGKENNNNENNINDRHDVKPMLFNFKTLISDFYKKEFVYQSDYDTNGVCYFVGTNFGQQQWENPAVKGLIKVNSSRWCGGDINNMVGRQAAGSYTNNDQNSWVTINFGNKLKIKPTAYTWRHTNDHSSHYLRSWNLEGSNDGVQWIVIKQHTNDQTLTKCGQYHTWRIDNCNHYYQQFRIYQTAKNANGDWWLMGTAFEVYGYLTGNK